MQQLIDRQRRFADLLADAIYRIAAREAKLVMHVEEELGIALEQGGQSYIQHLREGNIPHDDQMKAQIARQIALRSDYSADWLKDFLVVTGYSDHHLDKLVQHLVQEATQTPLTVNPVLFSPYSNISPAPDGSLQDDMPFIAGPPIRHPHSFFGRGNELQCIVSLWNRFPLQPIAVVGKQRSGKTSLLHYLRTIGTAPHLRPGQQRLSLLNREQCRWVFVDFQDARLCTQNGLFTYILRSLQLEAPKMCSLNDFMEIFIQEATSPTILLLDELSAALQAPEFDNCFWGSLRSLVCNYTQGQLGVLIASYAAPLELAHQDGEGSPFFNIFGCIITLGPFTPPEAQELIASAPIPFSEHDIAWILAQSKCWPILVQLLCRERLLSLQRGETGTGWREEALRQMQPFSNLLRS